MYGFDDEQPSRVRRAIIGTAVIVAMVVGWFVVRPALTDDDAATSEIVAVDPVASPTSADLIDTRPLASGPPQAEPTASDSASVPALSPTS